jgi:hypothetical protein
MAYSDFDLKTVRERFGLTIDESRDLFPGVSAVEVSSRLREILDKWAPAALAMNTEKARSEMIIAPILMEAVERAKKPLTLFSGVTFDVDKQQGLNGACDYLLTRSPSRFFISHPVAAIVEAKKEDIPAGLGQCVAGMFAARLYNEREGTKEPRIYGCVTTGSDWRFLELEGTTVSIDRREYYMDPVGQIVAILLQLTAGPI